MTNQEQQLLFFDDYFRKHKVDYMIFASSLLRIIREGKLDPADVEVDICVHGNDLNDHLIEDVFKADGYWLGTYPCREKYGLTYLTNQPSLQPAFGWIAMSALWLKKGICFINVEESNCIIWPEPKYYDKKTWSTVEYLDRKFKVPSDPEAWLEMWYGSDWRTPKACHWRDNANCKKWEDLWL
jgi:hypothetical protein